MNNSSLTNSKKLLEQHSIIAINRLSELIEFLLVQAKSIDQSNVKDKSHWLIENNDLFSRQLFKTQSDCFTPYLKETKQRLIELSRLVSESSISTNNEQIAKESLLQIEQQISAILNAIQSNKTMHQTAQMTFDVRKRTRAKIAKTKANDKNEQYNKLTKAVLQSSHQLYQTLNEHNEFERRLMDMVQTRQQQLAQCKSETQNTKLSQEVLALHQRLGRCRKAISGIERDIEFAEKR